MSIKALIAVRSGSVRVENKNIRPFADSNLLTIKIKQMQRISMLDGIVVNSNDETMLQIAQDLGCEIIKRDAKYASNSISMSEVYRNMAENFPANTIVYTNVTNPLIRDETICDIIRSYQELNGSFDSVNTAREIKQFLFLNGKPINYSLDRQPRSQDLPDIMALNFAVNVIARDIMISAKNVVGVRPFIYKMNDLESTDIDTMLDFAYAEFSYLSQGKSN